MSDTSKFKHRLRYYLIGFGLGCVAMFFVFGNRACEWLPENRVKNTIAEKAIIVGDSVWDLMKCQGLSSDDVYRFLDDDGDINFGDSKTRTYPKEYIFEGEKDNEDLSITFALYNDYSEVISFDFSQANCETSLSNKKKITVPIPDTYARQIIESKEMRVMDYADCHRECYGWTDEQLRSFHKDASVVMSETDAHADPNGYYTMGKKVKGDLYWVKYILGENRIRVASIWGPYSCDCVEGEDSEEDTATN